VGENVIGPCWDVCGVIDLEQFLPLEEHFAAIVIIVCNYGPPFYDRAWDVALEEDGTHLTHRCMYRKDVQVGPHGAQ
jgi:hypothetical protein